MKIISINRKLEETENQKTNIVLIKDTFSKLEENFNNISKQFHISTEF